MSDDIYSAIEDVQTKVTQQGTQQGEVPFDKEKWAEDKKLEREALYERIDRTCERVASDTATLLNYLELAARLPNHSAANTLLIFDQCGHASRVMSFEAWKAERVSVKKGAHAISILAPGDEYLREDGSVGTSFNVRKVFDVSQTTSRHLESRYPDVKSALLSLIGSSPASIKVVDAHTQVEDVRLDFDSSSITVAEGLEPETIFRELTTQIAHAELAYKSGVFDRSLQTEDAELAVYVLSKRFGIDTASRIPVLSSFEEGEVVRGVREQLSRVREVTKTITDRMNETLDTGNAKDGKSKQPRGANHDAR